jgi:hypothetical protein
MTSNPPLTQAWDVTLHRHRGHLVVTPQTTPPPGQWWRRPLLALAEAVDAPMVLDLTRLVFDEVVVLAVCECLRDSAAAPWLAIKLVVPQDNADRIRTIARPGTGVYGSVDAATTS